MKRQRQAVILQLVDHEPIVSQELLRRRLERKGFSVTQATLSRDLKDLGLVKGVADGAYRRPGVEPAAPEVTSARLQHAVLEFLTGIDHAGQLVVARTGAAQAQPLAVAMDHAALDGVMGTIAGDDTVLVICRDFRTAARVSRQLDEMARR
ncbi:MAG: arginine repressor [Acidobacteriota bacterium]